MKNRLAMRRPYVAQLPPATTTTEAEAALVRVRPHAAHWGAAEDNTGLSITGPTWGHITR